MNERKPRRSYIRRKRCLSECTKLIRNTLRQVFSLKCVQMREEDITHAAQKYAREVEAHCWSPRLQITDEAYQRTTIAKARELCQVLISKELGCLQMAPVNAPVMFGMNQQCMPCPPPAVPAQPAAVMEQPEQNKQDKGFQNINLGDEDDEFPMLYPQTQPVDRTNSPNGYSYFR